MAQGPDNGICFVSYLLAHIQPRWKVTKNGCLVVASGLSRFYSGPGKQGSTSLEQKAQKRNLEQKSNRPAKNSMGHKKENNNNNDNNTKRKRKRWEIKPPHLSRWLETGTKAALVVNPSGVLKEDSCKEAIN